MAVVPRVMIVDDNEIDNFVTRRVIEMAGFAQHVDVVTSGKQALEYFELNKDDLGRIPDIVLLDLNMPVVDGFVFLFEFDEFPQGVKDKCEIVVLSSILEKSVIDKILTNEYVSDFIPKPLTENSLKRIRHRKSA